MLKFRYGTFLQAGVDWLYVQSSTGRHDLDGSWPGSATPTARSGAAGFELGAAGSRYYRFRLTSDGSVNKNGVYIDNVRIACPGGSLRQQTTTSS